MARAGFNVTDPQEYDPDEVWRKASDTQGHSVHLRVNIPKHWGGRIKALIDGGRFGYRTLEDFARDSMYHRLHWAETMDSDPRFLARLAYDRLMARLDNYLAESEGYAEFSDRVDAAAKVAMDSLDAREFIGLIDVLRDEAKFMLREPFRTQILSKLDGLWDHFIGMPTLPAREHD